jgi:hypothetical protein
MEKLTSDCAGGHYYNYRSGHLDAASDRTASLHGLFRRLHEVRQMSACTKYETHAAADKRLK